MSEFKNFWQPVTEEYKTTEAPQVPEPQAAPQAVPQATPTERFKEKKAPIGIRIFSWYLFIRAGFYALLFFILLASPQSAFSGWLVDTLANFLHMPSQAQRDAVAREIQMENQAIGDGDAAQSSQIPPMYDLPSAREQVMVYLGFTSIVTTVVGCMWLFGSWKVRWVTMFYAGAFVAKAGISYFAGLASGVGSQLPAGETPILLLSLTLNLFIFLYLAFWPDVKAHFEELV
jgi:hypothetical protein